MVRKPLPTKNEPVTPQRRRGLRTSFRASPKRLKANRSRATTVAGGLVEGGAPDYFLVFGALALFGWVGIARLIRSQVLSLRESDYVLAARAMGASLGRILARHLLPNVTNIIVVSVTISLGAMAGTEIMLSWLGIGITYPHPSFGAMIAEGSDLSSLRAHPHILLVPATVVALLLFAFNLLGDALNDVLSPRRR